MADRRLVPPADRIRIITEQGHALGRPTTAELDVLMSGNRILAVELAATGAVVMRGSFHFDRQQAMATS
jgi:predicted PhzF superfamily epimerase YddE/YHI9